MREGRAGDVVLGEGCLGEFANHGEQKAAVAVGEVGRVALDLSEEADLFFAEVEAGHLLADGLFGEELGELEVEGPGDLLQGFERGDGVSVLDAREVTAEEAGSLLDVPLRHAFLEAIAANCGANIDGDRGVAGSSHKISGECLHVSH